MHENERPIIHGQACQCETTKEILQDAATSDCKDCNGSGVYWSMVGGEPEKEICQCVISNHNSRRD